VTSGWESLAAAKTFGGMTLEQFKAKVKPSTDARKTIKDLDSQYTAAQNSRDTADVESNRVLALVVNAVKGDPDHGEDSALYEAMGYVRKSERKSGLRRGNGKKPAPVPA
jgi:hypothetical protein